METDRKLIKVTDTVIRYQHEARKVESFKGVKEITHFYSLSIQSNNIYSKFL